MQSGNNEINMETKGEYLGRCNLTACTSGKPATWYNHGSYKHYCEDCAEKLNDDPYNKRDAMRMFGHDLCTPFNPEPTEPTKTKSSFEDVYPEYTKASVETYSYAFQAPNNDFYEPMTKRQSQETCIPVRNSKTDPKIQNNEPCPCESGKKYKHCCKQRA